MGKFFANQKQDAAGLVGITLQKLLVFFMVLDVLGMFCGSFFSSFLALMFHFLVFMGVYRRRTAVLCMYVVVHIVMFVLIAIALFAVASFSVMYMPAYGYDSYEYASGGDNLDSYNSTSTYTYYSSKALQYFSYPAANSTSSYSETSSYYYSDDGSVDVDAGSMFFMFVLLLVLLFIIVYTKILSVVLAHRMRMMLLTAPVLPVNHTADDAMEPTYVPADFEAQQQMFAGNPAFMPYAPMVPFPGNQQQQPGAMMPPPFMYGQQPVFYTFAPMPMSEKNEKL